MCSDVETNDSAAALSKHDPVPPQRRGPGHSTESLVPTPQEQLAILAADDADWKQYMETRRAEATIAQEQTLRTEPEDLMIGHRPQADRDTTSVP